MIPCASPLRHYRAHAAETDAAIAAVLASPTYILGPEVAALEQEFAAYCGVSHAVGVANGTDALILTLKAMGPEREEVITPSHTALATVAAIIAAGLKPVFVDIEPERYTLDPEAVEAAIGAHTRAIIAVHLYGRPARLDALADIARRNGVKLIEDCAQAAGARWRGQRVGGFGDAATFSFYPTKNLAAIGDGGMIVTNDGELAERLRRIRQYGWDETRQAREVGVNSRLDPLQAAIVRVNLAHLDADNARRRHIAAMYRDGLKDMAVTLPGEDAGEESVYHLYVIEADERDRLIAALAERGISAGVHYPQACHQQPPYAAVGRIAGSLTATERCVRRIVSLPMFPELDDDEVARVIEAVRASLS